MSSIFFDLFLERVDKLNRSPKQFPTKATREQTIELTKVPTHDEIKETINKLHVDKSPDPDGFNGAFFKSFWDIIGMDLVRVIQLFFKGDILLRKVNTTFITRVPKVKDANNLNQYRPISCVNRIYKIMSKMTKISKGNPRTHKATIRLHFSLTS